MDVLTVCDKNGFDWCWDTASELL